MEYRNRELMTKEITYILKEKLLKDYKKGNTKRGAHPKQLGLAKAHFNVVENLDENLKTDLLKPGMSYSCFIRFSSGGNKIKSDKSKDIRGMAIKLVDVNGKKYSRDEKNTQDFIMLTIKTMPVANLKIFRDAMYYMVKKKKPVTLFYKLTKEKRLGLITEILKNRKNQTSPLDVCYYSTTPYAYKNRVIKYCVVPKSQYKSELPIKLTQNYLTENMQNHLSQHDATFDFLVQFQTDKKDMPINDASVNWDENKSPFIKVAEIVIPKQNIKTKQRFELCENLSFSPGHSTIDHRPVGDLNIARAEIYRELSKFRHIRNKKVLFEPTIKDYRNLR
ncbi:MAG: hypothetical protein RR835_01670 [Peptostreptococcaceae bacterium]